MTRQHLEPCKLLREEVMIAPDEAVPCVREHITFHDCAALETLPQCPFPGRYCVYKRELEELVNWVYEAALKGLEGA